VIGEFLPMDKIEQGIMAAAVKLGRTDAALESAARGMMTTDQGHKMAGRAVRLSGGEVQITGIAKGAGMIGPNMATMLAVLMTDAALEPDVAQRVLKAAADESFNCISVDGHTSTSDTVLLLANGAAGRGPLDAGSDDLDRFLAALMEVCVELAKAVAADGEGASHLITIEVGGCADRASALQIARTIANSPLVKTAVTGCDPNWGRVVSAAGYAGVPFDPAAMSLRLNGTLLYQRGAPVEFDAEAVSRSMRESRDTLVELSLGEGDAAARFWTSDLTAEYIRINADYHT
jgi:glutamate N-acetyltransferase/amino-acid N-acetyltransferase